MILGWPVIILVIIILYPHQYLLMKMKWMYHTIFFYSVSTWVLRFIFPNPGEGWARVVMSGMSGSSLPQRHYCLGEWTSVAFQKSLVWVRNECMCVCVRGRKKKSRYLGLWFHFGPFWKVFLFFIAGVFMVQIVFMEKLDGQSYFSSTKNVRNVQRESKRLVGGEDNTMDLCVFAIF